MKTAKSVSNPGAFAGMWRKTDQNGEDGGLDIDKMIKILIAAGGIIFAAGTAYSRLCGLEAQQIRLEVKVDGIKEDIGVLKALLLGTHRTRIR